MLISLSAKGLTTEELQANVAEVHGAEVSRQTISTITDKVVGRWTDQRRGVEGIAPCPADRR